MITDEELLNWSRQGLIPFEGESEEAFLKRVDFCLHTHAHLEKHIGKTIPRDLSLEEAYKEALALYAIAPRWTPVIYSNEKTLPWHGGYALIFQLDDNAPLSAMIQLREKIYSFFGSKNERLVHEFAHVGRMGFQENKYEEILAYQASKKPYRKLFGPLFQSGWESLLFASLLLLVVVFDLLILFSGSITLYDLYDLYDRFFWLKILPLSFLAFLLIRLFWRQSQFRKVRKKLPLPLIYRLTDQEIDLFAKLPLEEIKAYFEKNQSHSLRSRLNYLIFTG